MGKSFWVGKNFLGLGLGAWGLGIRDFLGIYLDIIMECYLTYFKGHNADVNSLSTSGNIMASGSADGTIRIWDLNTHKSIRRVTDDYFFPSKSVENVSLSGFSLLSSTESRLFLFDIRNPSKILVTQSLSSHPFSDEISQISQNNNNTGCLSLDNGEIVIFNTNTLEIHSIYRCHNNVKITIDMLISSIHIRKSHNIRGF